MNKSRDQNPHEINIGLWRHFSRYMEPQMFITMFTTAVFWVLLYNNFSFTSLNITLYFSVNRLKPTGHVMHQQFGI